MTVRFASSLGVSTPVPNYVCVKDPATIGGLTAGGVSQLLDAKEFESRYRGRRRFGVIESLTPFAWQPPTTPDVAR